jgi:hypothetical protein
VSLRKLITKVKISTPPRNIHTSKLAKTIVANAKFNKNMMIHGILNNGWQYFFHKRR